jgi:hypothetical protein
MAQGTLTSTEDGPSYEQLIAQGVELRKEGHDADALAAFQRAYAMRASPRAAAQIALAHQALAEWLDAESGLEEALRASDDAWITRYHSQLEESLAAVQAHLGWLDVDSDVADAEIWIDGKLVGRASLDHPVRLVAGEARLLVRPPGYAAIERTMQIDAKSRLRAVFTFAAKPSNAVPRIAPVERPPPRARTVAWATLAGAGGLALVGIGGELTREWEARLYNDDSRCAPTGGKSRYDRCGTNRDIGSAAQTIAIAAFVGAGVASAISGWLFLGSSHPAGAQAERQVGCTVTGSGIACRGTF